MRALLTVLLVSDVVSVLMYILFLFSDLIRKGNIRIKSLDLAVKKREANIIHLKVLVTCQILIQRSTRKGQDIR